MTLIDAINDMLGWIGETPLDPEDSDYTEHPLYASALRILDRVRTDVLSRGWWFNKRIVTLTPSGGHITIGASYLTVEILRLGYQSEYAIRDGKLYDLTNGTDTITQTLRARVRELIAFEDLPPTAQSYIAAEASLRFAQTYDADLAKIKSVTDHRDMSYALFNSDHINNLGVNVYQTDSMGPILANVWYSRYVPR